MSFFSRLSSLSPLGKVGLFTGLAAATSATSFVVHQKRQTVKGADEYSEFTRKQLQKHPFSGMHEPFITQDKETVEFFRKNFKDLSHLLPTSVEEFQKDLAEKTPVQIRPLDECPVSTEGLEKTKTFLAVGGPPALVTAAARSMNGDAEVSYLCNDKWPIWGGSAFHIEEDSDAEAPTGFTPIAFMGDQLSRLLYKRESFEEIERTGMYSWRTLDWASFMKHREEWLSALKVAGYFQMKKSKGPEYRKAEVEAVANQCKINEQVYLKLNEALDGQLLFPSEGGLFLARDEKETKELEGQKKYLANEGRSLSDLSHDDLMKKYGFIPKGVSYKDKEHDRVLSPQFKPLLSKYIKEKGGNVLNGTLTRVFTNGKNGMAEYVSSTGEKHYIPFKKALMSLGNQQIYGLNGKSMFDTINATGSSGLALVYAPKNYRLPRVSVFGATNHVPLLSRESVPTIVNGKEMNAHVFRFTAGACVTPLNRGKEAGNHDGSISVGLYSTFKSTLGDQVVVKPLSMIGCNRVFCIHGQTDMLNPYPNIFIRYGAGGGGLTRAPDSLQDVGIR